MTSTTDIASHGSGEWLLAIGASSSVVPSAGSRQGPDARHLLGLARGTLLRRAVPPQLLLQLLTLARSIKDSSAFSTAVALATNVASKLTSAVFSFAKTWWGGAPAEPELSESEKRLVRDRQQVKAERPSRLKHSLSLSDETRCIEAITVDPSGRLAAASDRYGRVLLFDLVSCACTRIWKGVRGAQCGWLQYAVTTHSQQQQQQPHGMAHEAANRESTVDKQQALLHQQHCPITLVTFLVIHAPRRGVIQVWRMQHGGREAVFAVPATLAEGGGTATSGCHLLTTTAPIGCPGATNPVTATSAIPGSNVLAKLARCFFVQWNRGKTSVHEISIAQPRGPVSLEHGAHQFEMQELASYRSLPPALLSLLDHGLAAELAAEPAIEEHTREKIALLMRQHATSASAADEQPQAPSGVAASLIAPPPPPSKLLGEALLFERMALGRVHASLKPVVTAEFLGELCTEVAAGLTAAAEGASTSTTSDASAIAAIAARLTKLRTLVQTYQSLRDDDATTSDTNQGFLSTRELVTGDCGAVRSLPPHSSHAPSEAKATSTQPASVSDFVSVMYHAGAATTSTVDAALLAETPAQLPRRRHRGQHEQEQREFLQQQQHKEAERVRSQRRVGELLFSRALLQPSQDMENAAHLLQLLDGGTLLPLQLTVRLSQPRRH